jgi:hypothetical protein
MAINKLMEAAADILAQSKRNAGSMPMQKNGWLRGRRFRRNG